MRDHRAIAVNGGVRLRSVNRVFSARKDIRNLAIEETGDLRLVLAKSRNRVDKEHQNKKGTICALHTRCGSSPRHLKMPSASPGKLCVAYEAPGLRSIGQLL
jgi:hypothetical protein